MTEQLTRNRLQRRCRFSSDLNLHRDIWGRALLRYLNTARAGVPRAFGVGHRVASIALPMSLSRSSRAALIPSIRDPFTTPILIGAPFPIDKVHCHSSMPPWGLTEIFRSKGSYFDCIHQICPFGEPDQPPTCALFKLTHYQNLTNYQRPLRIAHTMLKG